MVMLFREDRDCSLRPCDRNTAQFHRRILQKMIRDHRREITLSLYEESLQKRKGFRVERQQRVKK